MRIAAWGLLALMMMLPEAHAEEKAPASLVPLSVKQVVLVNDSPAVLLLDESEKRYIIMFIDFFMANAIRMGMIGPQLERPLTHDLIGILLRSLGAKVVKITITELKNNTYYALISIQVNGEVAEFDARPSDALAIAVRSRVPIFAPATLLKPVNGSPPGGGGKSPPARSRKEPSKGKT